MKKNKKLLKGMTLVEVVVAMIIFFLMFSTIISVFAVAMKQINLSRRRDLRTAEEAMVVGKKVKTDNVGVNEDLIKVGGDNYTVTFEDGRESNNISLYESKEDAVFKSNFGFQLKTFGKSNTFLGLTTDNPESNEYRCVITNKSSDSITVYVTISGDGQDYIYEGSTDNRYIHSSKVYVRTIAAASPSTPKSIDFGFKKGSTSGEISEIKYVKGNATINIVPNFDLTDRTLKYEIL